MSILTSRALFILRSPPRLARQAGLFARGRLGSKAGASTSTMLELLNQQELRRRLPCPLAGSRLPLWVVTIGMGVLSMKRIAGWALGVMFIGGSLGAAELQVGDEAPDFELQGTDGKSGASAIKCCYAAAGSGAGAEESGLRALVSRKTSIRDHKGIVVAKKMSRKVSRRVVRPACIAGVRISRPNFRAPVRSDEVVIATEQLQVLIEPLRRASVGKRSSRKVCRALPDGQIQPLDERRVQCRRVLGVIERVFESPRGSVQHSPFDLDDTIVPARLEDLAVETRWTEEATDDFLVEFESIRDDQGKTLEIHPSRKVAKQSVSVPVASPSRHRRWPEPRPDFDCNEDPTRCLLVARERANLVGLKLFGSEAGDPSVIESTTHLGCLLEPAGDGVPGNPFDPGNRGNADTLDSESDDPIESSSSMLETVVGRAFRRGERLSALAAPVSTEFSGPGSVESVANDVSGTDFALQRTCEIETSAILHFGSALTMRELCLRNSGSNSSTQTG